MRKHSAFVAVLAAALAAGGAARAGDLVIVCEAPALDGSIVQREIAGAASPGGDYLSGFDFDGTGPLVFVTAAGAAALTEIMSLPGEPGQIRCALRGD